MQPRKAAPTALDQDPAPDDSGESAVTAIAPPERAEIDVDRRHPDDIAEVEEARRWHREHLRELKALRTRGRTIEHVEARVIPSRDVLHGLTRDPITPSAEAARAKAIETGKPVRVSVAASP